MNSGIFITFEGGEGSGKSTQIKLLYKYLLENNYPVIVTREPGGTQIGEQLRTILLQGNVNKINTLTEALMFLAARSEHWEKVIKPALDDNKIVICDRFHDSTLVYQGNNNLLNEIYNAITNNTFPNRTYLIDIDPIIGLKRSMRQDNIETRFESKSIEYHKRIQEAYLQIATDTNKITSNNNRYLVIDGTLSINEIHNIIVEDICKIINNIKPFKEKQN